MKSKQHSIALVQLMENLFPSSLLALGSVIKENFSENELSTSLIDLGWVRVEGRRIDEIINLIPEESLYKYLTQGEHNSRFIRVVNSLLEKCLKLFNISDKNLVGFSIYELKNLKSALLFSKILKKINPDTKTVFGGPYFDILDHKENQELKDEFSAYVDYVVTGDGKSSMVNIISQVCALEPKGDANFNNKQGFIDPEILEQLHKFYKVCEREFGKNILGNDILIKYNIGCGCVNKCAFCIDRYNRPIQYMPKEYILADLKKLDTFFKSKNLGKVEYYFECENFFNSSNFVKGFCEALISSGFNIKWTTKGNIMQATEDLFPLIKQSGCINLSIGLESLDSSRQSVINKRIDLNILDKKLKLLNTHKIFYKLNFIIGFPHETQEERNKILEFVKDNSLCYKTKFYGFALLKNSTYYNMPEKFQIENLRPFSPKFGKYCCQFMFDETNGLKWNERQKITSKTLKRLKYEGWLNRLTHMELQ